MMFFGDRKPEGIIFMKITFKNKEVRQKKKLQKLLYWRHQHANILGYKTIFNINVNSATFNTTTNPTRSKDIATNPPNIKISEVGIYDTDKNLVCVGKVSTPITLASNTITIELSMDF